MHNPRLAIALSASVLAAFNPANAGPLETAWLPSDATFVLHYDMERFTQSTIGQATGVVDDGSTLFRNETIWGQINQKIELNPFIDLKSVTLFNAGTVLGDAVGVAVFTEAIDELIKSLPKFVQSHRVSMMNGHEVHSWTEVVDENRHHWYAHVRPLDGDLRLCVVGRNWEQVLDTIDRVLEVQPAGLPPVMMQPPGRGSIFYAAMTDLDLLGAEVEWFSHVARTVSAMNVDLRELDNSLILDCVLRSPREEEAAALAQMLQGLVAMGRLALSRDPDPELEVVRQALMRTRITTHELTTTLQFVLPLDQAINALREHNMLPHFQLGDRDVSYGVRVPAKETPKSRGPTQPE